MIRFVFTIALLSIAITSHAENLVCGNSKAEIFNAETSFAPYFKIVVSNSSISKEYKFSAELEYFQLRCDSKSDGTPVFLILHFCGGSGCSDLCNFGIIDASTGALLLKPDQPQKGNNDRAINILGKKIPPFTCKPNSGELCLKAKVELG
jgi:hypothetical protein